MSWAKILEFLDTSMETPVAYGWFHIMFIVLSIVAGVVLCFAFRNGKKYAPRVVLVTSIVVILLEVYKMINFGFGDTYTTTPDYSFQWYAFPFQFCSTPMYVGFAAGLLGKGRIHNSLCAYLATYAVFAGLCVMIYPGDVFMDTVGINIQTMVCHGSMITIGIYLFGSGYVKTEHKTILRALPVFCMMAAIAMGLNEWAHRSGLLEQHDFNMFYFSPYQPAHLPVYSNVQNALGVDHPLSFIIYIIGFTLAAYVILLIAMGVRALLTSTRTRKLYA